ncbi:MAG: hypothetical protein ABI478_10420, partial [Propionivibrio sp.]
TVPPKTASVPPVVGQVKASDTKAYSDLFASVPLVPLKKQGKDKEQEEIAGAAAMPQDFRAEVREKGNQSYQANPAAVLLLMAWARHKEASHEERVGMLMQLETLAPGEQVRQWHGACMQEGIKPWQVLCIPAPLSGDDCTRCRYLMTRYEAIGEGRPRYHWACQHGYLILEHGKGTERLLVAPPECASFDRWYPSNYR